MAYCTTAEVKAYLGISTADDDALIATLIAAAQQAIDTHCNRTFEATGDTTRSFSVDGDVDGRIVWLDEDLAAITTVTSNADASSPDTLTSADYVTKPRNRTPYYALVLKTSSDFDWDYINDPEDGIEITGKWAYSETAPDDIKQWCIRLASYYYRQKDSQVFDVTAVPDAGVITVPQGLPADVRQGLRHYRRV